MGRETLNSPTVENSVARDRYWYNGGRVSTEALHASSVIVSMTGVGSCWGEFGWSYRRPAGAV